jgi:hypothetical protein
MLHPSLEALLCTRWFKYVRDGFVFKQAAQVPVIFEPPCIIAAENKKVSFKYARYSGKISSFYSLLSNIQVTPANN